MISSVANIAPTLLIGLSIVFTLRAHYYLTRTNNNALIWCYLAKTKDKHYRSSRFTQQHSLKKVGTVVAIYGLAITLA